MDTLLSRFNFYIIPPLLSMVMGLSLAVISVARGKLRAENVLFSITCVWWSLLAPLFICHHLLKGQIDLLMKIEHGIHFFYVYLPAVNMLYFYRSTGKYARYIIPGAFVLSFVFSLMALTDHYIYGLYTYSWGYMAKGGIALKLFGLYGAIVIGFFIIYFFMKIRTEKNQVMRLKLRYIHLSFIITGLLTLSNIPAMSGIDFYPMGNLMFIPLAFLGYGVLSNRLMDIRSVIYLTLMWAVMSSFIIIPNIAVFYFVYPYLGNTAAPVLFAGMVALFAADYLYLKKVQPRIDRLFNRGKYDLGEIESAFINSISTLKKTDELAALFNQTIRKTGLFKTSGLVLCGAGSGEGDEPLHETLPVRPLTRRWLVRENSLVNRGVVETVAEYEGVREGLLALFSRFDCMYIVPVVREDDLIALLVLPEKQNLQPLTAYEAGFIMSTRSAVGIALENSIMYERLARMNDQLEQKVIERTADLKRAMDALWGEMELAKKIQTTLLPRSPSIRGYEIAAYMQPADEVGGDYYDIINAEGLDWLVIGDVSGHGVPAGLIMMMVQTAIHTVIAGKPNLRPEALLNRVNGVITENIEKLDEGRYMTITVIACLNNGRFIFSGQHQNILIYRCRAGSVDVVETDGIWIGISDQEKPAAAGELSLDPGDTMLLYTDGITDSWKKGSVRDSRDPLKDMYGHERLRATLKRLGECRPSVIQETILDELKNYDHDDDITMVIIRRNL